jgi:hypothetical protein
LAFAEMKARMTQAFDRLERDQQGLSSTNGLMAVISGLKTLPGRKTVVFFADGLRLSGNMDTQLQSVAAAANRANVSIYAIDAGGLQVGSGTQQAREELMRTGAQRVDTLNRQAMSRPTLAGLERSEDLLRSNTRSKLGDLAESTGGFLVADTNDASDGFRRIQEEMRFYYVLSYAPTNTQLDGSFRTISLKVKRPGIKVHSRKGYLALPPAPLAAAPLPVRTYEAPALSLLDRNPAADDFPFWARALSFPEPTRRGRVPVLAGLPLSRLTFTPDEKRRSYRADLSVVARVRDEKGLEVDRLSQHYPVRIPADKLEQARRGEVLFFRETDLNPGRYTLEVVAYDSEGKQASVRRAAVEVPRVKDGALALSSVAMLKRVEPLAPNEQGRDNPLYHGRGFMHPNLGEPLSKATTPAAGFCFTVYVPGAGAAPRLATLEVAQVGQPAARTSTALPAPDGRGRIQHAAALTMQELVPGEYTLRISVASGAESATQETRFVVVP